MLYDNTNVWYNVTDLYVVEVFNVVIIFFRMFFMVYYCELTQLEMSAKR